MAGTGDIHDVAEGTFLCFVDAREAQPSLAPPAQHIISTERLRSNQIRMPTVAVP